MHHRELDNTMAQNRGTRAVHFVVVRWRTYSLIVALFMLIVLSFKIQRIRPSVAIEQLYKKRIETRTAINFTAPGKKIDSETMRTDFQITMEALQRKRQITLQNYCRRTNQFGKKPNFSKFLSASEYAPPMFYFSDNYKFSYCETSKVGCSQWKKAILLMENVNWTPESIHEKIFTKKTNLRLTKNLTKVAKSFTGYYMVMAVREPFERLVSAFYDKIQHSLKVKTSRYKTIAEAIRKKYHSKRQFLRSKSTTTFEDFVNFLLEENELKKSLDKHWNLFSLSCDPCSYRYNYIAKLETIEKDSTYIKKILQYQNIQHKEVELFPGANDNDKHAKTSGDKVLEAFAMVPLALRRKLYEMYRPDYEMFGYSPPSTLLQPE